MALLHISLVKWSFKVCISNFHGNRFRIVQFWFRHYTLCPLQIERAKFSWNRLRNSGGDSRNSWICAFYAKLEVFFISMATICDFPNSNKFLAVPVPRPSNRAVNEVSRPDGRARRAFVRIAPYILDVPALASGYSPLIRLYSFYMIKQMLA